MEAWRLVVLLPDRIPSEGADWVSVDAVCEHSHWTFELEALDEGECSGMVADCHTAGVDLRARVVADGI